MRITPESVAVVGRRCAVSDNGILIAGRTEQFYSQLWFVAGRRGFLAIEEHRHARSGRGDAQSVVGRLVELRLNRAGDVQDNPREFAADTLYAAPIGPEP
jgi:hypothetical protein